MGNEIGNRAQKDHRSPAAYAADFRVCYTMLKAINPTLASGQVEGATAMALGYALSEEVKFDDQGRVRNPGFVDYKVMSTLDMPRMTTFLVEDTEYTGPFGAKSAGEVPTNTMAPAIANAIYDALGIRIRSLPITPEKILQALDTKNQGDRNFQ